MGMFCMIDCKDDKFSRVLHDLNENLSFGQIFYIFPQTELLFCILSHELDIREEYGSNIVFSREKNFFQILKLPTSILEKKWKTRKSHFLAYFTSSSTQPKEVGNFTNFFRHFAQNNPSNSFHIIIGQKKLPTSVKQAFFIIFDF